MNRKKFYSEDDDHQSFEKFGKMRSKSRASKSKKTDLTESFVMDESLWNEMDDKYFPARVVEVHKRYCFVSSENKPGKIDTKDVWLATVAKKYLITDRTERNFLCVGDKVLCRPAEAKENDDTSDLPQAIIQHTAPRKSLISRKDPIKKNREHILASNIDQLMVVSSFLAPPVKWGLIDRYLVLGEKQRIDSIIVINKKDLLEEDKEAHPDFYNECIERMNYYKKIGYKVFSLQANVSKKSAKENPDLNELKSLLQGKVTLLSGHSGVGKSSITNLYKPQITQEVEPDSNIFYKGRHTTTYASFIKLGTGGYVIDTPGIRSFVVDEQDPIELGYGFIEIQKLLGKCKFRECRHIDEPGCAVLEALKRGDIAEWRYKNYLGILLGTTGREGRGVEVDQEGELI